MKTKKIVVVLICKSGAIFRCLMLLQYRDRIKNRI